MDVKSIFKSLAPHLGIVLIMVLMALIYMNPVLQGKGINQNDITQSTGMARELVKFEVLLLVWLP